MSDTETKLRRPFVLVDDGGMATLQDAIALYHATQDVRGVKTQAQAGSALAAICAAWLDAEHTRIRGTKGA